jgi:hypothetical protein
MKAMRATPPIAPPIMAPMLLGLAGAGAIGAVVAPEGLSAILVGSAVGFFELSVEGLVVSSVPVLDGGVVDFDGESVVVEPAVDGGVGLGVELGVGIRVELGEGVTVTVGAAFVCETVFAASAALDDHTIPAGQSVPPPSGFSASSA